MKYRARGDGFEKYYLDQVGHGLPVFAGSRMQRGHGLGNALMGMFRSAAMPLIKSGLRHVMKQGQEVAKVALKQGITKAKPILRDVGKQALKRGVAAVASEMSNPKRHKALRVGAQILHTAVAPQQPPRKKKKVVRRRVRAVKGDIFSA